MKRVLIGAVLGGLCLAGVGALAGMAAAPAGGPKEENCGAMMKQLSALPAKFSEFMTAIADGNTAHANWVGMSKDPKAQAEATAINAILRKVRQGAGDMADDVADPWQSF